MDFKLEFVLNNHHPPNIQMSPTLRTEEGLDDENGGREGSNGEGGGSPGGVVRQRDIVTSSDVLSSTIRTGEGSNDESGGREGSNGERGGNPGGEVRQRDIVTSSDVVSPTLRTGEGSNDDENGGREGSNGERVGRPAFTNSDVLEGIMRRLSPASYRRLPSVDKWFEFIQNDRIIHAADVTPIPSLFQMNGDHPERPCLSAFREICYCNGEVFVDRHTLLYSLGFLVLMERNSGLKLLPDILSERRNLERMTRIYIMNSLTKELEKLPKIPGIQSPVFGAISDPAAFHNMVLLVYRTSFSLCIVKGIEPVVVRKGERKHREWKHSGTWHEAGQITNILSYATRFYCLCSMRRLIVVRCKDGALSVEVLGMAGDNLPAEETTIQLLFESNGLVHAAVLHKSSADAQSISRFQLFWADLKNNNWVEIYGLSNKKILVISNAYSCSSLANRIDNINLSPAFFKLSTGTMDMRAASTSICEFHDWTVWRKGVEWIALSISGA